MPSSVRPRIAWSLREAVVIAAIFVAWAIPYLVVRALLLLSMFVIHTVGLPRALFRGVSMLSRGSEALLVAIVTHGAVSTVALYVLARAGVVIVDHYRGEQTFA